MKKTYRGACFAHETKSRLLVYVMAIESNGSTETKDLQACKYATFRRAARPRRRDGEAWGTEISVKPSPLSSDAEEKEQACPPTPPPQREP